MLRFLYCCDVTFPLVGFATMAPIPSKPKYFPDLWQIPDLNRVVSDSDCLCRNLLQNTLLIQDDEEDNDQVKQNGSQVQPGAYQLQLLLCYGFGDRNVHCCICRAGILIVEFQFQLCNK